MTGLALDAARRCLACDAAAWTPLYRELQQCERCGFVTARAIPGPAELARLYGAGYFAGEEYADYLGDRPAHETNFRRRFARITAVAGRLESLYEIGCAHGFWLQVAASRGVRAAGVDISAEAVRHARDVLGLDAACGAFEDQPLAPGQYGAFCMWDTLEHLPHPDVQVARVASLVPPGGWCFVTTGDIGAPIARREAGGWRMIHPPTHLQYFSRDTVTRFLARHGFETVRIESVPMCRSVYGTLVGLERFGHGAARGLARTASAVLPAGLTRRLRFTVDLGDIMLVCARRR